MAYECNQCGASFSKMSLLQEHRRLRGHRREFCCTICGKKFGRRDNFDRHLTRHSNGSLYQCDQCGMLFSRKDSLHRHRHQHSQYGGGSQGSSKENEAYSRTRPLTKGANLEDHYTLRVMKETYIPKFETKATHYKVDFEDLEVRDLPDILKTLKRLFQSLIDNITEFMDTSDLVRLSVQCPELDFPIALPFMKVSELTAERLLSEIERVLQSYEQFVLDETLDVELVHVHLPKGGTRKRCHYVDLDKMMKDKKCFIRIQNDDDLCCARAIVTARARHDNDSRWNSIRLGRKIQETLARDLHMKAGVPIKRCGIDEIKIFQEALPNFQIVLVSKEHFNSIIYSGPVAETQIYLYLHDEHYDVITSMPAFLNKNYYCTQCKKGYDHKEKHICNNPCVYCHQLHENNDENWRYCADCNKHFRNDACFEAHIRQSPSGRSTCNTHYRCKLCNQTINTLLHRKEHVCGERYCKTCKDYYSDDHQCYMQTADSEAQPNVEETKKGATRKTKKTYIFFDFECTQDDVLECDRGYKPGKGTKCINCQTTWCGSYEHRPNLCIAQKVCGDCMHDDVTPSSECEHCGKNEQIFSGVNTRNDFCKWLFSEHNYGSKVLCHNFKGYDSYPILSYLHENAILPEVITNGSKYLSIHVPECQMRFLDSINFLPMALADLPEAFGIDELAKGHFPHLFNIKENQQAKLSTLPDMKYYNPESMKPDKRKAFLQWYDSNKNSQFSFQDELLKYCRSDVDILRRCCIKFQAMFMEMTANDGNGGIDPFERCITIASACNLVYRTNFLQPESLGIIPAHGYRPQDKQSIKAIQWIKCVAMKEHINIQHAMNMGEKHIGPYKVDGYTESEIGEKIVYEFHGCFWHGCTKCFSRNTVNQVTDCTMSDLHLKTLDKQQYLEKLGYTYKCIWECEFDRLCKEDMDMRSYAKNIEQMSPLDPREAFKGGRTEAFTLYAEANENEKIKYYDVTSLYPYINKVGKVPLGHPEIITEHFGNIDSYEGLVKCKVLPPRNLYIPVLPYSAAGKLLFPLCRTCAETTSQSKCKHSDEERAITHTWVTDELKMALRKGYKLLRIHEVWHFNRIAQYDPQTKTGGVFTEYVNAFLKMTQEASGWPKWCKTEEDRKKYIKDYYDNEGILLDRDNIKKNPGLRRLAKLMLNSFWGKFGQRPNMVQSTYITDPETYFDMMTSDSHDIKDVKIVCDDMVRMDWSYTSDFIEASGRTNVVVAAYTTAQARLKLYTYLERLDTRVLYCDTDSVVFKVSSGQWEPELGDYLGGLTAEEDGIDIAAFVTGGPKNYAYTLAKPNKDGNTTCCKVRGITLNYKNSLDINFDVVKEMVTGQRKSVSVFDGHKICRDKTSCHLLTKTEEKQYKMVFDKRVITENYITLPYGM